MRREARPGGSCRRGPHLGVCRRWSRGAHGHRCIQDRLEGGLQKRILCKRRPTRVARQLHSPLALGAVTRRWQRRTGQEALASLCANPLDELEHIGNLPLVLDLIPARAAGQQRSPRRRVPLYR
jgi:hypothetical protein